jgi:Mg-chelatase subunit ChlD
MGLGLDYANAVRVKSDLQNANDTAVLYASRYYEAQNKLPNVGEIKKYLISNYDNVIFGVPKIELVDEEIVLHSAYQLKTTFMGPVGSKFIQSQVISAVKLAGAKTIEVALALDATNSMQTDGKMDALKVVAKRFVDQILAMNTTKVSAKIAIVPFEQYVNVGLDKRGAWWLDVAADVTATTVNECRMVDEVTGYGPDEPCSWTNDGVATTGMCRGAPIYSGNQVEVCKDWYLTGSSTWHGCVGSREYPANITDGGYSSEKVPGVPNAWCGQPILALTNTKQTLVDAIDGFVPSGNTYIPAGVTWAYRALTPGEPFGESIGPASKDLMKIMVVMTDGENQNSKDVGSPWHYGTDLTQADDWTKQACAEAKKAGITVYTVSFGKGVPGAAKKIMKDCATTADGYVHAQNSTNLADAFDAIAAKVRVSYMSR